MWSDLAKVSLSSSAHSTLQQIQSSAPRVQEITLKGPVKGASGAPLEILTVGIWERLRLLNVEKLENVKDLRVKERQAEQLMVVGKEKMSKFFRLKAP